MSCPNLTGAVHSFYKQISALPANVYQSSASLLEAVSKFQPSAIINYLQPSTEESRSLANRSFRHVIVGGFLFSALAALKATVGFSLSYLSLVVVSSVTTLAVSILSRNCRSWQTMERGVTVVTANILSSINDCLEFTGDLGDKRLNGYRDDILALLIPESSYLEKHAKQGLAISDEQRAAALAGDKSRGPTTADLLCNPINDETTVFHTILKKMENLSCSEEEVAEIQNFLQIFANDHLFFTVNGSQTNFTRLEQILLTTEDGRLSNNLPIVNSLIRLDEKKSLAELQVDLMDHLFTNEVFDAIPENKLQKFAEGVIDRTTPDVTYLSNSYQLTASLKKLLNTKSGLVFLYYLNHSINLSLVKDSGKIRDLNEFKSAYENQIANQKAREQWLLNGLNQIRATVLFTQEAINLSQTVTKVFYDVKEQRSGDGTYVLLDKRAWNKYEAVPLNHQEYENGKVNVVVAKHKVSGQDYCLASIHGSSKNLDALSLIEAVHLKFKELQSTTPNLKLVIGIDANTKKEKDLTCLNDKLAELGLARTSAGATTQKCRAFTTQISKRFEQAHAEEDFIIYENASSESLLKSGKGFGEVEEGEYLPSRENPSDHFPVFASFV